MRWSSCDKAEVSPSRSLELLAVVSAMLEEWKQARLVEVVIVMQRVDEMKSLLQGCSVCFEEMERVLAYIREFRMLFLGKVCAETTRLHLPLCSHSDLNWKRQLESLNCFCSVTERSILRGIILEEDIIP